MGTKYAELADLHAPNINKRLSGFEETNSEAIQAFGADLRKLLLEVDLGYWDQLHHSTVCVDIDNREGEMLNTIKVRKLLAKICRKGWNGEEAWSALVREMPLDPAKRALYVKENLELIERSDKLLAPILPELLRGATGAGSHTTAVLKLAAACENTRFAVCEGVDDHLGHEGFLSHHLILQSCPSLAAPMNTGIRYFVVRAPIADKCPELMRILSEADNAKHSNFQKESSLQAMLNIHRRAVNQNAKTKEDLERIARAVSRGQGPGFLKDALCYAKFVQVYGGGENKDSLIALVSFQATLKFEREVAPENYEDMSKFVFVQGAQYILALVKATMACPEQYYKNGRAAVFTTADLNAMLGDLKPKCLQAVRIMNEAIDLATLAGILETAAWARIKGNLDIRLVMHIHTKKANNRKTFKDLRAIAEQCYCDLVAEFGSKISDIQTPWPHIELASKKMIMMSACAL